MLLEICAYFTYILSGKGEDFEGPNRSELYVFF